MTAQPAIEHLRLHDDEEMDLVGTDWHQYAFAVKQVTVRGFFLDAVVWAC